MFRRSAVAASVFALGLIVAPSLQAQAPLTGPSCNAGAGSVCDHLLTAVVPTLVNLTLENSQTNLGSITALQFDSTQYVAGPRFDSRGNVAYTVSIEATTATFGPTGNKNAGDVRYLVVPAATGCGATTGFNAVGVAPSTLYSGARGSAPRQQLCFNVLWNYATDEPGNYDLPLDLTITAP